MRLHAGFRGFHMDWSELCFSDSIACTIPVTLFFGEAKVREWDQCCLLRVFKHCFLNHVVSCHCFGISVVEIEN